MSVAVGDLINQPDPDVNVLESAHLSMRGQQVRAALEELPTEQREVIELAYFSGLTRQDIARTTGVPLGTVHTRARLGLQKLQAVLLAAGFERDAHDG
jgi:RNA polymerase sigma-70 factor (ECF subfamily)